MKKLTLALVACIGLSATPLAQALIPDTLKTLKPGHVIPAYALFCIMSCLIKESKENPEFKFDSKKFRSMSLTDKSWWQNLLRFQDERMIGQRRKDKEIVPKGDNLKISLKSCPATGLTGKGLGYLKTLSESRKTIKDVALLCFAVAAMKGNCSGFFEDYLGWNKKHGNGNNDGGIFVPASTFMEMTDYNRNFLVNFIKNTKNK